MRGQGFTYIEQLLLVTLIAIIGAMSAVYYSRFLMQGAVQGTEDQLVGQLRKAQNYALTGKAGSSWGVSYSGGVLTLFATSSAQFNETFTVHPNVNLSGLSTITFQKITGLPNATPTITISGGPNAETVTVNAVGTVDR